MSQTAEQVSHIEAFREAKANRIRELSRDWTLNTIQLGEELKAARDTFERTAHGARPGWAKWLSEHVGFDERHARKLIRINERFAQLGHGAANLPSMRVLEYLAADHVPEDAREEVVERIASGETIGKHKAKKIVDQHRPKPAEANRIARETGTPTHASDGNIYFGHTKEEGEKIERRIEVVYGVRDAVETLASMDMEPSEFLSYAQPHQLWRHHDEHQIGDALAWLGGLSSAWEQR